MTDAPLTLDGFERIDSIVQIGGDYAQFRSPCEIAQDDITGLHDGQLHCWQVRARDSGSYRVLDREKGEGPRSSCAGSNLKPDKANWSLIFGRFRTI